MTHVGTGLRAATYFVVLVASWSLSVRLFEIPHYILPTPEAVGARLLTQPALFLHHGVTTAIEIVLALIIGTLIGFAAGVACWTSTRLERNVFPVLVITQALPVFAIAPLLVTWFGYGLAPKLVMATLIVFFPVALSTLNGLKRVPAAWRDQATVMQATPVNRFLWIMLPAALATIAVGVRLAAVSAPIGAIVGEWVGSAEGLGFLMLRSNQRVEIDTVFAALFVLCGLTLSIYGLVHWLTDRLLHWSPQTER
ncbi:MAG: ABC transporter permease [Hyphomicrobiaceae bacterium]